MVDSSVHVEITLEDSLLILVGDVDGLGVVSDRTVHDGKTLCSGVRPAANRGRSGETGNRAALGTRTHVVSPVEAI